MVDAWRELSGSPPPTCHTDANHLGDLFGPDPRTTNQTPALQSSKSRACYYAVTESLLPVHLVPDADQARATRLTRICLGRTNASVTLWLVVPPSALALRGSPNYRHSAKRRYEEHAPTV